MINDRENRLCCRPKFGVPEHPAAWLISLDRTVEQIDRGSG
jgi:predicted RNA polymerase sigma factor